MPTKLFKKGDKKPEGSGRPTLTTKEKKDRRAENDRNFVKRVVKLAFLQKKYIREMKSLKGKQFIDAYHTLLEFTTPKFNKVDAGQVKIPQLTIHLHAAAPTSTKGLEAENIINIPHEELITDN